MTIIKGATSFKENDPPHTHHCAFHQGSRGSDRGTQHSYLRKTMTYDARPNRFHACFHHNRKAQAHSSCNSLKTRGTAQEETLLNMKQWKTEPTAPTNSLSQVHKHTTRHCCRAEKSSWWSHPQKTKEPSLIYDHFIFIGEPQVLEKKVIQSCTCGSGTDGLDRCLVSR